MYSDDEYEEVIDTEETEEEDEKMPPYNGSAADRYMPIYERMREYCKEECISLLDATDFGEFISFLESVGEDCSDQQT